MRRFWLIALATLLVLASAAACDLNPQPLPPIDGNGTTTGPSGGENGLPPPTTMEDSGAPTSSDSGVEGPSNDDAGDAGSDAGDADVDAGDDGGITDDDDAG
ncbi:hypothetical protein AKJ09_03485 [Labilithrix luteola]|uniref:Uncharacterized protein n=1 Tax=Labilithrix luteola TaxID=1391654 RepID=A0A0K1PTY3_9BACT|nr:hypothetical protein [Labilithrix luteola]AKU96821.1 hypothetical protein AKJ09_03485 [Labilithrix luteola]